MEICTIPEEPIKKVPCSRDPRFKNATNLQGTAPIDGVSNTNGIIATLTFPPRIFSLPSPFLGTSRHFPATIALEILAPKLGPPHGYYSRFVVREGPFPFPSTSELAVDTNSRDTTKGSLEDDQAGTWGAGFSTST